MPDSAEDLSHIQNRILLSLRPAALSFLKDHFVTTPMAAGQVLYPVGAPFTHAVFPHRGVISLMAEMDNGRSIEKGSVGPEGFLGVALVLGSGRVALSRSTVQVGGYASWISLADLAAAYDLFIDVRAAMQAYAQAFIGLLMESVACNSLHAAEQRVMRWLLHASDRVGGEQFLITQEAISLMLGLRRATVSEVCSRMQDEGLVHYRRGAFVIVDRPALEKRVCECYGRVRQGFARLDPADPLHVPGLSSPDVAPSGSL